MSLRKITQAALALGAAALLLTGCATGSTDPVGTWGSDSKGEPQLELSQDGVLSGTDGCNRLMSSWAQKDDVIDFGQVASTLMACEGVDTWLSQLHTGKIDGDTLHILDADGEEIGSLKRS